MNIDIAVQLCQRFEGFRSKPYLCPAGVPTIGYGSTRYSDGRAVTLNDPAIDEPTARALLVHELLNTYAPGVLRLCPGLLPLSILNDDWSKFCAIVDFCYNLGVGRLQTSTLRRRINECNWTEVKAELMKWVYGGGRVLPGLLRRREAEASLVF